MSQVFSFGRVHVMSRKTECRGKSLDVIGGIERLDSVTS